MDYKVIDVLRGPSIVLLDALLSRKLIFPPISSVYLQFLFRFFGACASMLLLASNQAWLIEFYRFIVGAFLLALSTFLQTYLVASCYETYKANHTPINESIVVSLLKTTIESKNMQNTEIDLTIKISFYLLLQLMLYRVFICKYLYGERGHWIGQSLGHFLSTLSSLAVLLNLSEGIFVACTFVTLLPQFLPLHSAVFMGITLILQRV
uniref:TRC8-like N-terminal domain-containing protein n=1 Tax=Ciona savignyi TaxID=51511 RepID=H2YTG9_CIOSA